MQNRDVLKQLLFMNERDMEAVINYAFREYAQLLADIYNDIYDSCINLYYSTYSPIYYNRHGDPSGFNLYSASDIYASDLLVNLTLEAGNLLPYAGKRDKRDAVLSSVLDGLRGAKSRKSPPGWPMSWHAYYPNEYSKLSVWESSRSTLDGILQDFAQNGVKNTSDQFWNLIRNNI